METKNDYNFSLFKPNSDYNRQVRNIILTMLSIWAVAIFGFQVLLKVIEKPVPEKAYTTFESVWENVKPGQATAEDRFGFSSGLVAVLGKSAATKADKQILSEALSWNIYSVLDSLEKESLIDMVKTFKTNIANLGIAKTDAQYVEAKTAMDQSKLEISNLLSGTLNIEPTSLEANIIAFNLLPVDVEQLSNEQLEKIPAIMKTYLVHNQSALTDAKFLGFPFHYFYTAEFLLILFVVLCLVYSLMIDRLQKKLNIVD